MLSLGADVPNDMGGDGPFLSWQDFMYARRLITLRSPLP
jgi:hypothetical protein